jgi:endonuclease/exonuclease/phosphatase family metal-dependent hydrolase
MRIRVLSINIWDLPVPIPGFERARRRRDLLEQLPGTGADLVLIQEAFLPRFKPRIAEVLPDHQCDRFLDHRRRRLGLEMDGSGGLMTFSRFRLLDCRYVPFECWPGMKLDERIGKKGCLWVEVETPGGPVRIGNVHLYAGLGPTNAQVRAKQTRHLLDQLAEMEPMPTVLAGDFNMALELEQTRDGPNGFELLDRAGFTEIAAGASTGIATMSAKANRFARYLSFRNPERRLTQVFYRGGVRLAEPPQLTLDRPPVSDHLGLIVTLELAG